MTAVLFASAGTAFAGSGTTSTVVAIDKDTITLDETVTVTVSTQKTGGAFCEMDGTISVYIDGVLANSYGTYEDTANTVNYPDQVVELNGLSDFAAPGTYEITADYVSDGSMYSCYSSALSAGLTVTVTEAVEDTTVTTPPTTVSDVLARTGGGVLNAWMMAAVASMLAGLGAVLARRRA